MILQQVVLFVVLAQIGSPATEGPSLEPYMGLLYRYRQGEIEDARRELSEWPESQVTLIIEKIERIKGDKRRDGGPRYHQNLPFHVRARTTDPYIQAAVLLHTDLALSGSKGRLNESREYHLGVAQRLSELIEDTLQRRSFGRDWLLAIGYYFQSMLASRRALEYFEEALDSTPNDADVLLAAGTALEDLGWRLRRSAPSQSAPDYALRAQARKEEDHYKKTRSTFELALKADSDLLEARLRLGRTQQSQGNLKESLRELRACAEVAREPQLRVLSHLFLGQVLEKQGQIEESSQAYRIAFETDPGSQVAATALSHVLHLQGHRVEARETLANALIHSPRSHSDPWWRYPFGRSDNFELLLGRMREDILF